MIKNTTIVIFLIFIVLLGIAVTWGLPSAFPSEVDSLAPLSPLAFVGDYSNPNIAEKYPATHQILTLVFYTAVIVFFKVTGQLGILSSSWPFGFTDPSYAFSILILVSRLISVVMATLTIITYEKIFFDEPAGEKKIRIWFSMLLLAGSGIFTYYARTANLDVPYLFWWVFSFVFLWKYIFGEPKTKYLILVAVFSALSIGTKDQAAGLVFGTFVIILLVKPNNKWEGFSAIRSLLLFGAILLITYFLVAVLPQPYRWLEHIKLLSLSSRSVAPFVQFDFSYLGYLNLIREILIYITRIISPLGLLLSCIGTIALINKRQHKELLVLLIPVVVYLGVFVLPIRFVYERFLLPVAYIFIVLAGIGVVSTYKFLKERLSQSWLIGAVISVVIALQFVSGYIPVTYMQVVFDQKKVLANQIENYIPKGSIVMWEGRVTGFPNSNVYENYIFIRPEDYHPDKTFGSVLKAGDMSNVPFILSESPLEDLDGYRLMNQWVYPEWIKRKAFKQLINEYYLYSKIY